MSAIRKPTEPFEEQQDCFLLNSSHIVWKVAVPVVTVIIGYLLAGGVISG